ncbi:hypothetical protein [Formosa algae]|uniref:Uncharacterized protein n=1 Tax=Formosa algae TaxID=225843 RepID=A0A9X1CCE2_9FLAO|nr:hypothetical protein [Formosa algae]MBP1841022.1 hypothetical protein [Formosa algae]MDQ0336558.1 hypothetical protein [Formosa algae]OEI81516.1 hypothetical protein AST99_04560 [Formosa algae]
MKKLFINMLLYAVLIALCLEVVIRLLHLTKDYPVRYVDEFGVEKWVPNQRGFAVTGIRRQHFSEYHINNSGYNSYREFHPTPDQVEIALVGDSFIEGFHQQYTNSIGKKIEQRLKDVEVYEYGYAGYDFADQLHMINTYKETFDLVDYVVLGLKFENDLTRSSYTVVQDRMKLETPLYKTLRQSKLLVYLQNVGTFDAAKSLLSKITSVNNNNKAISKRSSETELQDQYIINFKRLVHTYGYDKQRFTLLLDAAQTPPIFLKYLEDNGFRYLDFSEPLQASKTPTNLIYDMHWNNHGRTLIAELVADFVAENIEK